MLYLRGMIQDKTKAKATAAVAAKESKSTSTVKKVETPIKTLDFETLEDRVTSRNVLKRHMEKLKNLGKQEDFVDELKNGPSDDNTFVSRISLTFGDSRTSDYDIKNATLVQEVSKFLQERFVEKLEIIENEIALITR